VVARVQVVRVVVVVDHIQIRIMVVMEGLVRLDHRDRVSMVPGDYWKMKLEVAVEVRGGFHPEVFEPDRRLKLDRMGVPVKKFSVRSMRVVVVVVGGIVVSI